jgi:hypothetical protein
MVRPKRLELLRITAAEPKSAGSTNSPTDAYTILILIFLKLGFDLSIPPFCSIQLPGGSPIPSQILRASIASCLV